MIINCAKALVMGLALQNNFEIPKQEIVDKDGRRYSLRKATEADIKPTTVLIRESFQYWVDEGVPVSPAKQTAEQTRSHLIEGGFVLENDAKEVVGTFTLEEAASLEQDSHLQIFYSNPEDEVAYQFPGEKSIAEKKKYLVFKKLAISPDLSRKGLGQALYDVAEAYSKEKDYSGVLIETVIEARWLYDWYIGLGYEVIGSHKYEGSQFETLLLKKDVE